MAGFKSKRAKSKDIQEEYIAAAAREMQEEIDFSILAEMLVEIGWTKIVTNTEFWDPDELIEIKKWLSKNIKGSYKVRKTVWLFEDAKDATIFVLRWGYI